MAIDSGGVAVVVVTRNRKDMLRRCLASLLAQTAAPARVFVVDNASSDGTSEMLISEFPSVRRIKLAENLGGAGGFHEGFSAAVAGGHSWLWVMDDDCVPARDALEKICAVASPGAVYGSVTLAEFGKEAFSVGKIPVLEGGRIRIARGISELGPAAAVETIGIGFGGLFISAAEVARVGLPRADFFVYADDSEYSRRIRLRNGLRMFYVPASVIQHPALRTREVNFFGGTVQLLDASLWKSYYNVRNQTYVTREYHMSAAKFFLLYVPRQAVFLVLRALFLDEGDRLVRCFTYLRALFDGAAGRLGKRDFKGV